MGQALSDINGEDTLNSGSQRTVKLSDNELRNLFTKKCLAQFKQIEIFAIKTNLQISDLNDDKKIDETEFVGLLKVPALLDPKLISLLYRLILMLGEFPFPATKTSDGALNVPKLLRAAMLLSQERTQSVFGKEFDYTGLIILMLLLSRDLELVDVKTEKSEIAEQTETESAESAEHQLKHIEATIYNNKLSWSSIEFFSGVDTQQLTLSRDELSSLFAFCLSISSLSIEENRFLSLGQLESHFKPKIWKQYEKIASSLIRAIDYNYTESTQFKVSDVVATIKSTFPNLLSPLSYIFNILLIMPNSATDPYLVTPTVESSKIIDEVRIAQLLTFLPIEMCYTKMRKLYVGKESGFSMRSFESKVMKWNAPTILFVQGSRIDPLKKKLSKAGEAFVNDEYPRFKPSSDLPAVYGVGSEKLLFGVYVHKPWKSSNKDTFGDSETVIFQLEPQQQLFKLSSFSQKFVYFSTLNNGGIGFGCDLPLSKNGMKRYQPGNVSLLIDGGLEFCTFRHIGPGGSFQTGSAYGSEIPEYEDKFIISNLEVYGVGSDREIQEQLKQWEWEKKEAEARQRVNIQNLGEERSFLEMAGLVGQGGSGGSV